MSQTKAQLVNPAGVFTLTDQLVGVGATFSGNVSIAGTLTKQDVTNVDSVGVITARSDIIIGGNIAHLGDTDTKIAFTDNQIDFQAHNSSRLYINRYAAYVQTGFPVAFLASSGDSPSIKSGGTNNQDLLLTAGTSNPTRLHIQSDGKIGVGKTNPAEKLDVAGAIQVSSAGLKLDTHPLVTYASFTAISGGTYAARLGSTGSSTIRSTQIYGGGTEIATFDGVNQRLGIGTLAPNYKLELAGANSNNYISLVNTTAGDADGNRFSRILFRGTQSGGEVTSLAAINGAHEGTADDQKGNISFRTNDGDDGESPSEKLRIGSAGQIGIAGANYGTAGQVIISGGSGASVAWGDAAGGAEYAGISSGAISTGNPVVVRNDGKLEKVKYSWNESITTGALAEGNNTIASAGAYGSWARNDDGTTWSGDNSKRVLFIFRYGNSPGYRTADYSGNTLTLNSLGGWNDGDGIAQWDAAYNSNAKRWAAVYRHNSNGRPRIVAARPSGTTVTWGTGTNGSSGRLELSTNSTSNAFGIEYAGNDKFMVVYGEGSKIYAQVVTNSSGSNYMQLSAGTRTEIEDTGTPYTYRIHVTKPDSNGRMLVFYMKPIGGDAGLRMAVLTISGTDVSYGGRDWVSSTNKVNFRPAAKTSYDPNEDRYLLIYERISDSRMYGRNMKIDNATTISMSAETQLYNQDPYEGGDTVYDTNLKKHFVYLLDNSTNKQSYVPVTFTGSAAPTAGTLGIIYNNAQKFRNFTTDYDPTLGKILFASRNASASGSGDYLGGLITKTADSTSNLTADNFIGLSKGNYTDGNTAKVLTSGSLSENQSSLTIGQKYFVQPDGTINTSKASSIAYAGQAVSSTDLLVASNTIPQSTEGILGYWEWGLCNSNFKPWCTCGCFIGAYDNVSGGCNFCMGQWFPQSCRYGDHHQGFDFTENIPDSSGGNMCACCGGYKYDGIGTCCCSWNANCGDGRFGFPSTGLYCYNLEFLWAFNSCRAQGGCMTMQMYYRAQKCRNTACNAWYCPVNGYAFNLNHCNFCDSRYEIHNVRMSGKVPVADTDINVMSFRMYSSGVQHQLCSEGIMNWGNQYNPQYGCYSSKISFTKISNNPGYYYC